MRFLSRRALNLSFVGSKVDVEFEHNVRSEVADVGDDPVPSEMAAAVCEPALDSGYLRLLPKKYILSGRMATSRCWASVIRPCACTRNVSRSLLIY